MLDKPKAIPTIINKLEKIPEDHYIDLRTYKRNRSVIIVKQSNNQFYIIENGYEQHQFTVSLDSLQKTLKKLFKREFPRSNKIRLYSPGEFSPQKVHETQLKKL